MGISQVAPVVNYPPAKARDLRDTGSIPGLGRSTGGGHGNPLQYSCLEHLKDRGGWRATVHGVSQNPTWLKRLGKCTQIGHWEGTGGLLVWWCHWAKRRQKGNHCIERAGDVGIGKNKQGCLPRQRKETMAVSCDRTLGSLRGAIRHQTGRKWTPALVLLPFATLSH